MWAEACALLDEAERKHRHFFELLSAPATPPVWEPPVDIFTDGGDLRVTLALPGARAEDVTVQLTSTGLQVEAQVSPTVPNANSRIVRMEIPYGRMRRRIDLPAGRYVLLERHLDKGCLFLRLTRETP